MSKFSKYRVLIPGILSPLAAVFLYVLVYSILSSRSAGLEKDGSFACLFRLAMVVPFIITLALAIQDRRSQGLSLSGKVGLALAVLSLGLSLKPVRDGMLRSKQSLN